MEDLSPFGQALAFTLKWEGGFVNDPDDPGGATCYGVTQKVYDARHDECGLPRRSVRQITRAEVQNIYSAGYWRAAGCDKLDLPVAIAVFDTAVNFGPMRAKAFYFAALGEGHEDPKAIAKSIVDQRIAYRYARVKSKPSQAKFLKGWLNRDNALAARVA